MPIGRAPEASSKTPMLIHYLTELVLTMINPLTVTVHQLQLDVLHEINQLNKHRQGILEMEVDVRLASMPLTPSFAKEDICSPAPSSTTTGYPKL
jgi:hypothetical protein